MNLFELVKQLTPTTQLSAAIPSYLYGAFRRKSISFCTGLTDETTIVYWFQSRTFTIDLRLKMPTDTPIVQRQGWIGQTCWDEVSQSLSWQLETYANYQNHVQWPEPATLHAIGNCILEFSPSNVYVEDWRQQATSGLFLGLRLKTAIDIDTAQHLEMDGGLVICGQHMAYALTRLPEIQQRVSDIDFQHAHDSELAAIESFEVSVGFDGKHKRYSTCSHAINQPFNLNHFEVLDTQHLIQHIMLDDRRIDLIFAIDMFHPEYQFQQCTETLPSAKTWLLQEQDHLFQHATQVI